MGTLRQALHGQRVYLDANIFIYALEGVAPWAVPLHEVFAGLEAGEMTAVTSNLSLAECLVRPFSLERDDLVQLYRMALTQRAHLDMAPIHSEVLVSAARLRAQLGFKLPDAIHTATALTQGCTALLTNDAGFRRAPDIKLFLLSEWA
jgi:predicted nucleic acid-binding protein